LKNWIGSARAFLAPFVFLSFIPGCRLTHPLQPDRPQLAAGVKTQDISFHSISLNRQVSYRVFLPADVPPGRKLPIVYLLHGAGNDFRTWSNASNVAEYARKGLILVMPDGDLSYYVNAVEATDDKYEDYITHDLIADVESRFPARNDRAGRAIVGVSMGGYAAVYYALKRPELFIFAGALSPAIDVPSRHFTWKHAAQWWRFRRVFGPVGSRERNALDPFQIARTANPQRTPFIYLTAGEQEPLLEPIHRFAAQLDQRGFAHEFQTKPGGHDWSEWDKQIPACFARLLEIMPVQQN
jgi:S-formylglutathione hydrolase FrmB